MNCNSIKNTKQNQNQNVDNVSQNTQEEQKTIQLVLPALPYIIKQIETQNNKIRIENIKEYYRQQKSSVQAFQKEIRIENSIYLFFNISYVVPLSQVLQKLEEQLQKLQKLSEAQIIIVENIEQQIFHQMSELYTKRQINHTQISEENILIVSNKNFIYTWNKLVSFDIKFVNFADNLTMCNEEAYKVDIQQLRILFERLFKLSKKSTLILQNITNHLEFNKIVKLEMYPKIKQIILFPRICLQQQEDKINELFSISCVKEVELPIQILRSIVFQIIYINNFDQQLFNSLMEEYIFLENLIIQLHLEFQNYLNNLIEQTQNSIDQHFKFKFENENLVQKLTITFGQNLFTDYFKYSQFNYKKNSLFQLKKEAPEILEKSKVFIQKQITEIFQERIQIEILNLIKELI